MLYPKARAEGGKVRSYECTFYIHFLVHFVVLILSNTTKLIFAYIVLDVPLMHYAALTFIQYQRKYLYNRIVREK